jgi:hypothetical protein
VRRIDGRGEFMWDEKGLGWDVWKDEEYEVGGQTDLGNEIKYYEVCERWQHKHKAAATKNEWLCVNTLFLTYRMNNFSNGDADQDVGWPKKDKWSGWILSGMENTRRMDNKGI